MKYIIIALKGIIFGIANLIPGVSGGTMAVITKVYEKLLNSINNLFKKFKESFLFLFPYGIGILLAVLLGSKLIDKCIEYIPIPTISLFVGLVLGGIPLLYKPLEKNYNIKNIIIQIIAIIVVLVIGILGIFLKNGDTHTTLQFYDYILLFVCGFIASIAMILPGMSGMLMFMLFGYYDLFINTLANLSDLSLLGNNILILLPIGLGILAGLFTACKVISYLLKKYPTECYFAIMGFVLASIVCVLINLFNSGYNFTLPQTIIGIIMIPIGFLITYFLSKVNKE